MIKKEYNYENLYLKPRKTIIDSRSECDTSVTLGNRKFKMPVIPANMMSVVDESTCEHFANRGYFYVMHRFNIDPLSFTNKMHERGHFSSISVGVNEDSYYQLNKMKKENVIPEYITIDIAHCWCSKGERMIKFIRDTFPDTFLISGNVATAESISDLEEWGSMAQKIFVGPGKVCTT